MPRSESPMPRRLPNSADVARLAGVSRATVSYVFNGRRDGATVPEATRERILAAASTLGYRPNRTARALKTGRTHTIALWSASFSTPYYASVLGHVQERAKAEGYEIVVITGNHNDNFDPADLLADGAIVIDLRLSANTRAGITIPIVSMGAFFDRSSDHVGIDLYQGTLDAIRHVIATGKQRLAYMTWHYSPDHAFMPDTPANGIVDPRIAAYLDFLREQGASPIWIPVPGKGRKGASDALRTFWDTNAGVFPDAILCLDDVLAIGALHHLRERGIRAPEEIAVVGCDGIEEAAFHVPPLTTLAQPVAEATEIAWRFLQNRLANPDAEPQSAILTPDLIRRGSA